MSRRKQYNQYVLSGEYGVGYTSNTGREFYFDKCDYVLIKDYCWNEHILSSGYSALEAWDCSTKKIVRMHWLIVGKGVDHINHNPLDNRRNNLRVATQQENIFNKGVQSTNKSGIIGVFQRKDTKKWVAQLRKNGRTVYYDQFDNFLDAVKARLKAESQFFGEYSPQISLFSKFGIMEGCK